MVEAVAVVGVESVVTGYAGCCPSKGQTGTESKLGGWLWRGNWY